MIFLLQAMYLPEIPTFRQPSGSLEKSWGSEDVFYGKPFRDYEISAVYVYDKPVDEKKLVLQESEVEAVKWMDFQECCRRVEHGSMKHCIYMDELEIVGRYLDKCEDSEQ